MDTVTAIKNKHEGKASSDISLVDLYLSLTPAQAKQLALHAIDLLDGQEGRQAEYILEYLACLAPEGLQGIHKDLLDRQHYFPGFLFRNADEESRERLIESIPGTGSLRTNHLLLALAWIGDEKVQQTFKEWRESKPGWISSLHVPPEAYAQEAGWELMLSGRRRDLFFHQCYPLIQLKGSSDREVTAGVLA